MTSEVSLVVTWAQTLKNKPLATGGIEPLTLNTCPKNPCPKSSPFTKSEALKTRCGGLDSKKEYALDSSRHRFEFGALLPDYLLIMERMFELLTRRAGGSWTSSAPYPSFASFRPSDFSSATGAISSHSCTPHLCAYTGAPCCLSYSPWPAHLCKLYSRCSCSLRCPEECCSGLECCCRSSWWSKDYC